MGPGDRSQVHGDMVFRVSSKKSPTEVKLKAREWGVITQLNGRRTVTQIGEVLALTPEEILQTFEHLIDEELLELVEDADEDIYVPDSFFKDIEAQLTYYMGPVSSIILEEILNELKRTRKTLERRQIPFLIELLSLEISNDEKRFDFQKRILKKLKGLFDE